MLAPQISELYVSIKPTDFRRSYDGLSGVVRNELGREPSDGSLYVFFNNRRDQIKILYYSSGGYCLWQKRLERGTFTWVSRVSLGSYCVISPAELLMIIEGISLENRGKRRLRHAKNVA